MFLNVTPCLSRSWMILSARSCRSLSGSMCLPSVPIRAARESNAWMSPSFSSRDYFQRMSSGGGSGMSNRSFRYPHLVHLGCGGRGRGPAYGVTRPSLQCRQLVGRCVWPNSLQRNFRSHVVIRRRPWPPGQASPRPGTCTSWRPCVKCLALVRLTPVRPAGHRSARLSGPVSRITCFDRLVIGVTSVWDRLPSGVSINSR